MTYVYILRSSKDIEHYYVGVTEDLRARLQRHNAGEVSHTSKHAPWTIKTYVGFPMLPRQLRSRSILSPHQQSIRKEKALIFVRPRAFGGSAGGTGRAHSNSDTTTNWLLSRGMPAL